MRPGCCMLGSCQVLGVQERGPKPPGAGAEECGKQVTVDTENGHD